MNTNKTLIQAVDRELSLFRDHFDNDRANAQQNLSGRTHYVDTDTLRFFDARITFTKVLDNGLLFGLIESINHPTLGRRYRPVIFDLTGEVITRPDIDDAPKSKATAEKLFWQAANDIDAVQVTRQALARREKRLSHEACHLRQLLAEIDSQCAAEA